MVEFIFRSSTVTETAKQDAVHHELLKVLADHILALTDKETVERNLVVFHRRFVAQTYCTAGADLRVSFTDQVREAWVGANL
tara:strand:- start:570 stop:815 length:246 start_codon:yes stop_codon:yes gene_type:complete